MSSVNGDKRKSVLSRTRGESSARPVYAFFTTTVESAGPFKLADFSLKEIETRRESLYLGVNESRRGHPSQRAKAARGIYERVRVCPVHHRRYHVSSLIRDLPGRGVEMRPKRENL